MTEKVKPIRPEDVGEGKWELFPDAVIEAFNELITENFVNGSATVKQGDAVKRMVEKGLDRKEINDKGWLNVEEAFKLAGWDVSYDGPGYCETYPATFKFERRKKRTE